MIPQASTQLLRHDMSNYCPSATDSRASAVTPDSGFESSDETTSATSDQTKTTIVRQVESYFSEENLRKDAFLLKHVKRNRDGFVSLKLIASLRRIKQLTKSWEEVASAVQQKSSSLVLNDEGNKVRRTTPLPLDLLLMSRAKRIVLVHGLKSTAADDISKSFASHGTIVSMRLFTGGDMDKVMAETYPHLDLASSALLEYESAAAAEKAVKSIQSNLTSWRSSLGAVLFGEAIHHPKVIRPAADRFRDTGRQRSRTLTDNSNDLIFPLRQKSHSYNAFERIDFMRAKTRSEVHLHRQPRGPDGSRGFHQKNFA